MADEEIVLNFKVPDDFWADADRRFEAMASRFQQQLARGGSGGPASPGGGGASGSTPGGGGGNMKSEIQKAVGGDLAGAAGALFDVGAATLQGAQQGLRNTRGAAASSSTVLLDNAVSGGLSSFVESTVGKIPILGDILVAQMNAAKDAIEIPRDRATAQLHGSYGSLAKGGYEASDDELKQALDFQNEIQRRGYEAEQRIDRMNRELHPTSAAFGLTSIGGS